MNARLVLIDRQRLKKKDLANHPAAPYLVVEQRQGVFITRLEWGKRLPAPTLEAVMPDEVHEALGLGAGTTITLSPVRELPTDDLLSEAVLTMAQQWWVETVSEWLKFRSLVKAS